MNVESFHSDPAMSRRFIDLAWQVRAGDSQWIPPFRKDVERELSTDNEFMRQGDMRCFLALEAGKPVARCAAILNRELTHQGQPVGLIGFYESEPRPDASAAVLDAAMEWLRAQGMKQVWGPMNFSIWHSEYRVMTRGFDTEAFLGEPRNPAYYPDQLQAAGFTALARYYSWDLTEQHLRGMLAFAEKMADPAPIHAAGLVCRPLDMSRFEEEMTQAHRLLASAFSENLGYTSISAREFLGVISALKHMAIPELVPLMWAPDGRAIGFGYLFPDYAEAVRRMNGESGLFGKLRFLMARGSPDRLIFHTVAVEKEYRRRGLVETVLADLLKTALARGLTRGVGALAKEGPTLYSKTGEPTREYMLLQRAL